GFIASQRCPLPFHEFRIEPRCRPLVLWNVGKARGKKGPGGFQKQVEPRLSLVQSPDFQLTSKRSEVGSREKIFELWRRRRHAACNLVTADAREHDAISL